MKKIDEFEEVLESKEVECIWFYREECGACALITPYMGMLTERHPGINFSKAEFDEKTQEFYLKYTNSYAPLIEYELDESGAVIFDENDEPKTRQVFNEDGTEKMQQTIIVPNFILFNNGKLIGSFPGVDLEKLDIILSQIEAVKNGQIGY